MPRHVFECQPPSAPNILGGLPVRPGDALALLLDVKRPQSGDANAAAFRNRASDILSPVQSDAGRKQYAGWAVPDAHFGQVQVDRTGAHPTIALRYARPHR